MEITLKLLGAAAGIFALYKIVVDINFASAGKRRAEYAFIKEYLEDLKNKDTHPLIVERGFLALSGLILDEKEIRHILSQQNPSDLIISRKDVSKFLQYDSATNSYIWKSKYDKALWKSYGDKIYLTSYTLFAFSGLFPILFISPIPAATLSNGIIFTALFTVAIYNILIHGNIKQAYKIMANQ